SAGALAASAGLFWSVAAGASAAGFFFIRSSVLFWSVAAGAAWSVAGAGVSAAKAGAAARRATTAAVGRDGFMLAVSIFSYQTRPLPSPILGYGHALTGKRQSWREVPGGKGIAALLSIRERQGHGAEPVAFFGAEQAGKRRRQLCMVRI